MNKTFTNALIGFGLALSGAASAQITLSGDYKNFTSAQIGTFQNINFREAGFSALAYIPGTNGQEFWTISDRGVNVDCASANTGATPVGTVGCVPTYDKMFAFPNYAPKIHRVKINGDSIQILQTITMKRPGGTTATGLLNPAGLGSTTLEAAATNTVSNCANYVTAQKDVWGIDSEGLVVDQNGNFWISEEGGPTIWKLDATGTVVKRYTPYATLANAQPQDVPIDTVFKYRKNNRGFECLTMAPNGKLYALIQSPLLFPNTNIGEASQVHRLLEIDVTTNATRTFAYLNDGVIGTGSNQIRLKDWKCGDIAAINNNEFLVIEAAARGNTDIKRVYKIDITNATPVTQVYYNGQTLEALATASALAANSITPVNKTLFIDLLANGWPSALDKSEGIAIVNDSTVAFCNDNDFAQTCPNADGIAIPTTNLSHILVYSLKGNNKLSNYQGPATGIVESNLGFASLSLFPNPAQDQITVNVSARKAGNVTVNVYDITGKLVMPAVQRSLLQGEQQIMLNTANLNNGVYFVEISSGTYASRNKVIVMHP